MLKDHLEKLHYFYQVALAGSFKEASKKIAITQPSLTKSIQILEGTIEKQLFLRQPRGVQLTVEGELLFNYCTQLFSQLQDIELQLQDPEDPMAGALKVGTYDSIAIYFWPDFLRDFLPRYPRLNLDLTTDRSATIQEMVERGVLDLGLIIEPQKGLNTEVIILKEDRFQLYQAVDPAPVYPDIESAPMIFMPDALAGSDKVRLFKAHPSLDARPTRKIYRTSSLESTKELLLKGIGIALLPEMVAKDDLKAKKIRKINIDGFPEEGVGPHKLGIIYPKHKQNSKTLQKLIEEIKEKGI